MRAFNRIVAALFALAIVGAGGLTAAEVVVARTTWAHVPLIVPYNDWLTTLKQHSWHQTYVVLISIGVLLVGLLLILASLRGGEKQIPLTADRDDVAASTSPRALARTLSNEAAMIDGIDSTSAKASRRKVKVRARVRLGEPTVVAPQVGDAVRARLAALPLAKPPRLSVKVTDGRKY